MENIEKIKKYAINCHKRTNHKYDNKPYKYHLKMVYDCALEFEYLLKGTSEQGIENILASCWTHDLIEDTRQTYNDVKKNTNQHIADITYALTNEKGKTRKERANRKYYEGINKIYGAVFVKMCDRIANVRYSKSIKSSMFDMYSKENDSFLTNLFIEGYPYEFLYKDMIITLKGLFL